MITTYTFFRVYRSIQLHFTSSFDVLKYGTNSKTVSIDRFNNCRNQSRYMGFAHHLETEQQAYDFCVANFFYRDKNWIYDSWPQAKSVYIKAESYFNSFKYKVGEEVNRLATVKNDDNMSIDDLINRTDSGRPAPLLQLYLADKFSAEFICTLNDMYKFLEKWSIEYTDDPYLKGRIDKLLKYSPFVRNRRFR